MILENESNQDYVRTWKGSAKWSCALPLMIFTAQAVVWCLLMALLSPFKNERGSFVTLVGIIAFCVMILLPAACSYGLYLGVLGLRVGDAFSWCALGIGLNLAYLTLFVYIWLFMFMFLMSPPLRL